MSVLLDALKKAALEKKSRDGNSHLSAVQSQKSAHTDLPLNTEIDTVVHTDLKVIEASVEESIEKAAENNIEDTHQGNIGGTDENDIENTARTDLEEIDDEQLTLDVDFDKPNIEPTPKIHVAADDNDSRKITEASRPNHNASNSQQNKVAFSTLLEKNRRLDKKNKIKTIVTLFAVLTVSIAVIGFYYYYAQMSKSQLSPSTAPLFISPISNETILANDITDTEETGDAIDNTVNDSAPPETYPTKENAEKLSTEVITAPQKNSNTHSKGVAVLPVKPKVLKAEPEITIKASQTTPFDQAINHAYQAFNSGDINAAKEQYQIAVSLKPYHRDALLGNAAVAMVQQRYQDALELYQKVLDRSPKDEFAQAGILAIASTEKTSPELFSKVNSLLQDHPESPHLHFLKGALLALQEHWSAAQISFFNAWTREPSRADYAYNLAVALDHIHQPKEALKFYQTALDVHASGPILINVDSIKRRVAQLESIRE